MCRSLLMATLLGMMLTGCSPSAAAPPPMAAEVVTSVPVKTSIVEWDEYVGRLAAIEFVEVRARVSGYLDSTHFDEGQVVREGDLLCVIDPRPFVAEVSRTEADVAAAVSLVQQAKATVIQVEAEVKVAEARYDLAVTRFERSRPLVAQKAMSQEDLDIRETELSQSRANVLAVKARLELSKTAIASAEAAVESSKALLAIAKLNVDYTQVRAPISGRVSSRLVTDGNLINGGNAQSTVITTIVSLDPIHCNFDADEQSYLKYVRLGKEGKRQSSRQVKTPVYVGLANEPNSFPHRGHIDFVDNRMDPETGTMRGRAILANPDLSLTPGLFARVRFPGSGRYDAVLIPDLAIGTDQSEKYVFVIDKENKARRQVVEIGPIVRGLRIIRKGLDGSERFVLRGLQRVRPGEPVVAKVEKIQLDKEEFPGDGGPVPKEQWLSRPPRGVPKPDAPKSEKAPEVKPESGPQSKLEIDFRSRSEI
ncbi:MAG: efflux RND transporter periplasmic adaptor subunit [Planctomycetota bacterium]